VRRCYAVRVVTYLVVANQTLGGIALTKVVKERATMEDATIHIVVPATEPAEEHRRPRAPLPKTPSGACRRRWRASKQQGCRPLVRSGPLIRCRQSAMR
jgi:hypothetical protein